MIDIWRKTSNFLFCSQQEKIINFRKSFSDRIIYVLACAISASQVLKLTLAYSHNLLFVFVHFRGFAFVQFKDSKQANAVCTVLYNSLIMQFMNSL